MSSTEIISGKHAVLELLRAKKRKCYNVWIARQKKDNDILAIENESKRANIPLKIVDIDEISSISKAERHQGVAAKCDVFPYSSLEDVLNKGRADHNKGLILILDGILDPQNLGSLIRTAYLCGVHGIVFPKDNSAQISPTVVKTSSGATEYISIVQVTNVTYTLKYLKDNNYWVVGAVGETNNNLYDFDFVGHNYALILGSEGKGIRRLTRDNCDYQLSIPMHGKELSYNVSVAGAIFMSEIVRQRSKKS